MVRQLGLQRVLQFKLFHVFCGSKYLDVCFRHLLDFKDPVSTRPMCPFPLEFDRHISPDFCYFLVYRIQHFAHIPWAPMTLPKSPRRLRILAKACSSRKSHIHCAAPRGVRVDHRLAGEIIRGTCKNIRFYKVFTVTGGHSETSRFISFLSNLQKAGVGS